MATIKKPSGSRAAPVTSKTSSKKSPGKGGRKPAPAQPREPEAPKVARARRSPAAKKELSAEERHEMIARAAFFIAEHRGFLGGNPLSDWLLAEREVLASPPAAEPARRRTPPKD
ncbi:MAG: DUF2934 domain-containing protein [Lysobacter sp.]|nr:DUF2934 domain-containing protein [Lysobacter sp.]